MSADELLVARYDVRVSGAMHVATIKKQYVTKDGQARVHESYLLRRSIREGSKVKHETLANLTRSNPEPTD